jgi:hypothetical protein
MGRRSCYVNRRVQPRAMVVADIAASIARRTVP